MSESTPTESAQPATPAPAAPSSPEARMAPLQRLFAGSSTWILLILLAIIVAFSILRPADFATVSNGRNVALDTAVLLVLSTGMTFVIITAGIDLSVGSVLVFASIVGAKVMSALGGDGWGVVFVGLLACLAAGTAWGVLNGFLIARAKVPALIVTLGTLGMALGGALLIAKGVDSSDLPTTLTDTIGIGRLFDQIPYLVIIAIVVAMLGGLLLHFTRFGRYTYAIGSNVEAAERAGISVDRHLIKVYALGGMLSGLAGFLSMARFSTTSIAGHSIDNLQAIAAVVLGGTSLFGGVGAMLGTVVGALIPSVLNNGLVIVEVQPFWQQVAVGAILIAAVYFDQLRRRLRQQA
jgi:ribose transport system permease protein